MFVAWIQATQGQGQTAQVFPAGTYGGLAADTINTALFNNTSAPDNTVARTLTGFNTGQWVTANEVIDTGGTNWVSGGRALASKTTNVATNVFTFDAADTTGAGNVTLTNAFGCMTYDNGITAGTGGVAKQGVCYNYFGGGQSVTAGTFTIVWNASGIFTITCT
jgi:hypothetical protein